MRVLFVPHCPCDVEGWEGSRPYHLCRQLGTAHDLHVVTWQQGRPSFGVPLSGGFQVEAAEGHTRYKLSLLPNFYRLVTRGYPRQHQLIFNQMLFRRSIKRLCKELQPDVLLYAGSHHFTGYPPFRTSIPMVFDYVDKSPQWVETEYVRRADAVVTVSEDLARSVGPLNKPTTVIPNGVDVARYASVSRAEAKEKLGLGGTTVVSLIGLTCDPSLYFVDAVRQLRARVPDVKLLIVGGGAVRDEILRRCDEIGISDVHAPGSVRNADVHWYFAATDVGLYPGADTPYFRESSPLKIVEYAAAAAQVVTSPVVTFERGWPNVHVAKPSAEDFSAKIYDALQSPRSAPSLESLDWSYLASRLDHVMRQAVRSRRQPVAESTAELAV